ncbi:MAG TPA: T9SS type A sorting domain-containing protein [Saprospiraceae bacterium]|nr:T9SS type A sorting domain-containing protein [Saprospiraceae bacterium]
MTLSNSSGVQVSANKAYQNYLPGSTSGVPSQQEHHDFRGIWSYYANDNLLLDNISTGNFGPSSIVSTNPDNNYYYRGLRLEESGSNLVKCNYAEGMNQGLNFKGACVSQHMVRTNTLTNNRVGLYLYNGTMIGQQFNQDNQWPGTTGGNDFEAKFDGIPSQNLVNLSLFRINDPDINSDYWAVPREPQDWFKVSSSFTPHFDCLVGPADPGGDDRSESDIRAIGGTFPNFKDYPGSGFDANLRAYEVLHNNPDLLVSGSPDAAFFNAHQYGNLGKIFRAKNDLERIGKMTAAVEATWVGNMNSIAQALADIAVQDSLYRESPDPAVQQQAAQNLTALRAQLSSLQQTNQFLSAQYASDIAAKAAQLNTDLGAITPTNGWEQNLKTVIATLRQQVADGADTWTAAQYNALNSVAGQCRHEGGIAVVMARAALQQFNYDDEAMCPGYTAPRPSSVSEQEILTRLSPNPAQEQCEVIFGQPLSGSLILTDLAGKVHSTLSLEQASSLTLNTHALPNGIYSLRLLNAQGSRLTTQKLVVLH